MKTSRTAWLTAFLVTLMCQVAFAVTDVGGIEEGASSLLESIVNLLAGPIGGILAVIGFLAAWFEHKSGESKYVIFVTLMVLVGPFLFALAVKALYLNSSG